MPSLSCLCPLGATGLFPRRRKRRRRVPAAQRDALLVHCDLRLNLVLANIQLLSLRIWFYSGFWLVSL